MRMNDPAWQVWVWLAGALVCWLVMLVVNPWRGLVGESFRVVARAPWLVVVAAVIGVGEELLGAGMGVRGEWEGVFAGGVETACHALTWVVSGKLSGLLLLGMWVVGWPGVRAGMGALVPERHEGLWLGMMVVGVVAMAGGLWWQDGGGWLGMGLGVLSAPWQGLAMVVVAERWRAEFVAMVPVGGVAGWQPAVVGAGRDRVAWVTAVGVVVAAAVLPLWWAAGVWGLAAVVMMVRRWVELRAGGVGALAGHLVVVAGSAVMLEAVTAMVGARVDGEVGEVGRSVGVVAAVWRAVLATVMFGALVMGKPRVRLGGKRGVVGRAKVEGGAGRGRERGTRSG